MAEKIKVFIAEDDQAFLENLVEFLSSNDFEVVVQAGGVEEALKAIANIGSVDVALIDGNLSEESKGATDGEQIAQAFREKFPGKPVLSIASGEQDWSDRPEIKKTSDPAILIDTIKELLSPHRAL